MFNEIINNGKGEYYNAGIMVQDCLQYIIIEGNCIINNDYDGIFLLRTSKIVINQNDISQNQGFGLFLIDASSQNLIYNNNFINNKICAFFLNCKNNKWNGNYWNRPRLLPKPIFGTIGTYNIIPWLNFDWHPAQEPYDMEV